MAKKQLKEGEIRKHNEMRSDLVGRQERYLTLNVRRDEGRSRIDRYFKKKNMEHTMTYKNKIMKEDTLMNEKKDTIDKLSRI